jgi:uncharacterized membrane protein
MDFVESKHEINWLWIVPISLILPVYQLFVFFVLNGYIGPMIIGSLVFVPAGMLEGAALLSWLARAKSDRQRRNTLTGFVIGFMFAFIGSLVVPLILPNWLGATIGGAAPWLLCTWIGYRKEVPETGTG